MQVLQRKLELARQGFNSIPQVAIRERRQLIEQGLNDCWVDDDH